MSDADLALRGATVLTADERRPVIEDGVVVVRGDRLAFVGGAAEAPVLAVARTLDLPGRVITPGFVNVHTHAILTMARGMAEDMGFAPASTLINDTYVHAASTVGPMAEVGLRVVTCGRIHDVDFTTVADGRWDHDDRIGDETLEAALALAERWQGKAEGRIGVQLSPHAGDTCSDGLLRRVADASRRHGLRVNTHLAQSRAEVARVRERSGCTPAELLDECGLLNDRLIAAHCVYLDDRDIERVARSGMTVAHVPKGNATGGMLAPTPKLRRAGARLALGTDNMHADMIEVMRWALAVARIQEGRVTADWQPHTAQADLVVVDFRRPHLTPSTSALGNLVHTAQGRDVELVIVDGRIVVEGGRATQVDEGEIRRAAAEAARALWSRARQPRAPA